MAQWNPLFETIQPLDGQRKQLYSVLRPTKFRFSDEFNYANGNLSGNGPWLFAFPGGGCATLGCTVVSNQVQLSADTVGGHWTAVRVSTAPFRKSWRIQCTFRGFGNNNLGRWGFGLLSAMAASPYTLDVAFGITVRRVVNFGVVTNNSGYVGPACVSGELSFPDTTIATGDVLRMITAPSGADDYTIQYFKNNVLLATRTETRPTAGAIGSQPCFYFSSAGGTQGISIWDSFACREL